MHIHEHTYICVYRDTNIHAYVNIHVCVCIYTLTQREGGRERMTERLWNLE